MSQASLYSEPPAPSSGETGPASWFSQKVTLRRDRFEKLIDGVPVFERAPFELGGGVNAYHDVIVSRPGGGGTPVPVATVSKQYALIQHRELLATLEEALRLNGVGAAPLEAELWLSEYGERMLLYLRLAGYDFDPGDGHSMVLRVRALNSVDGTCALGVNLNWFRLVCENSMTFGFADANLRRIHVRALDAKELAAYLNRALDTVPAEQGLYRTWRDTRVDVRRIDRWVDETLAARWGGRLAARACHIGRTGFDGPVVDASENAKPHARRVASEREVPGACAPVSNLFHLSQTLSWLAKQRNTIQDRLEKTKEIPELVEALK